MTTIERRGAGLPFTRSDGPDKVTGRGLYSLGHRPAGAAVGEGAAVPIPACAGRAGGRVGGALAARRARGAAAGADGGAALGQGDPGPAGPGRRAGAVHRRACGGGGRRRRGHRAACTRPDRRGVRGTAGGVHHRTGHGGGRAGAAPGLQRLRRSGEPPNGRAAERGRERALGEGRRRAGFRGGGSDGGAHVPDAAHTPAVPRAAQLHGGHRRRRRGAAVDRDEIAAGEPERGGRDVRARPGHGEPELCLRRRGLRRQGRHPGSAGLLPAGEGDRAAGQVRAGLHGGVAGREPAARVDHAREGRREAGRDDHGVGVRPALQRGRVPGFLAGRKPAGGERDRGAVQGAAHADRLVAGGDQHGAGAATNGARARCRASSPGSR